jgi:hypothetical protein
MKYENAPSVVTVDNRVRVDNILKFVTYAEHLV